MSFCHDLYNNLLYVDEGDLDYGLFCKRGERDVGDGCKKIIIKDYGDLDKY